MVQPQPNFHLSAQSRDVADRDSSDRLNNVRPDKTNILHVRVVTSHGGGPDKTIARSAQYANDTVYQIEAAYIHSRGEHSIAKLQQNAQQRGCPFWTIGECGPADPRTLKRLLQLCRSQNISIWHGHDYKSNLYGLLLRRWWPMKLVTTVHGWTKHTLRTRAYYHIDNWCLKHYDHVMVVNHDLFDHCLQHGVAPDRLTHIPNGIEPTEYDTNISRERHRNELGIGHDRLVVGMVGRLSPEKGFDRAIQMMVPLRTTYPNVQLHLIGDGPQQAQLETLVNRLGLRRSVKFWGWQDNAKRFYTAMDVLLLSSHTEGLPNTALEAMTMGIPVAATNVGGIADLLDHGRCGVILSQDHSTWPDRLDYLLTSIDRRRTLSRLARTRIEKHYTFSLRMKRVFGVYQNVLNGTSFEPNTQPGLRKAA